MPDVFAGLEVAVRTIGGLDPSLSCQLAFTIRGHATRIVTVTGGTALLVTSAGPEVTPSPDACRLDFTSERVYLSAMSGNRAKTIAALASGGLKLSGDAKLLQDPRFR